MSLGEDFYGELSLSFASASAEYFRGIRCRVQLRKPCASAGPGRCAMVSLTKKAGIRHHADVRDVAARVPDGAAGGNGRCWTVDASRGRIGGL
jgi:hypothetical protein